MCVCVSNLQSFTIFIKIPYLSMAFEAGFGFSDTAAVPPFAPICRAHPGFLFILVAKV